MPRLDPNARRRLDSCLSMAEHGATAGERAAGLAAAERIAAATGMTLAQARAQAQGHATAARHAAPPSSPSPPGRAARTHSRTKPRTPSKAQTVEERLREMDEELADQRKRAAEADRRLDRERAVRAVWEDEMRAVQAVRDREWAQRRDQQRRAAAAHTFEAHMAAMQATLSASRYARHSAIHCSR
ncbi:MULTISPECIES: hypothetical protein [unclassified Methylobacterium]|uniref:hypothetical protein n=1 Tax=unclassified Methylobacterium TaxID=2615210 RepID=UPI00226A7DED|nr:MULTISPECIES: hypothetical protein [unclassified Methylobacterium]